MLPIVVLLLFVCFLVVCFVLFFVCLFVCVCVCRRESEMVRVPIFPSVACELLRFVMVVLLFCWLLLLFVLGWHCTLRGLFFLLCLKETLFVPPIIIYFYHSSFVFIDVIRWLRVWLRVYGIGLCASCMHIPCPLSPREDECCSDCAVVRTSVNTQSRPYPFERMIRRSCEFCRLPPTAKCLFKQKCEKEIINK